MSAFEVRALTRRQRNVEHQPCFNRCRSAYSAKTDVGFRSVTHEVLICGYPTLLCTPCATAWRRAWEGACDHDGEEVAA